MPNKIVTCAFCALDFSPIKGHKTGRFCSALCKKRELKQRNKADNTLNADDLQTRILANCIENDAGCMEWQKHVNSKGYGRLTYRGCEWLAHRLALCLSGEPPLFEPVREVLACHSCDNPSCCNPKHLFWGSNTVNIRDAKAKGRLRPRIGTNNGRVKLTEDQVYEIRRITDAGFKQYTELGKRYGVSNQAILRIAIRYSWRHLAEQTNEEPQ